MPINKEREFIKSLEVILKADKEIVGKVCAFLHKKIGKDSVKHIDELSEDSRVKACIGHITIALTSGNICIKEIKRIVEGK